MKLFLSSRANHPDSIEKLKTFIDGFEGKSIAYIPTAANGEHSYGEWKDDSETWKTVNTLGANVTPVVLEEYRNSSVIEQLKGKDIIWFAGGACGYLMYWIRRCGLDIQLREILESGSIYVGSSAGSMIAAPTFKAAEWYLGEPEVGGSIFPGFGFIPFEIYPHYQDDMLNEIQKNWSIGELYLLKDGEVITVVDGRVEVLGEKRVLVGK